MKITSTPKNGLGHYSHLPKTLYRTLENRFTPNIGITPKEKIVGRVMMMWWEIISSNPTITT